MIHLIDGVEGFFNPKSLTGAIVLGVIAFALTTVVAALVRKSARRIERRLSDVTTLHFVSVFAQLLVYLIGLVLYAHLIPGLRAFGTALLAGASVASVVVGLAAQDTLGNLVAGFSLVLSRSVQVDDTIHLYCPVGVISAKVHVISLAFTILLDDDGNEVVVPNSVMMSSAIVRVVQAPSTTPANAGTIEAGS